MAQHDARGLNRRDFIAGSAALAVAGSARAADPWPNKPVTLVVPFPPGGNTDTMARIVAERLGPLLKQTFVVENKPGAGSMLGSSYVARAQPDGYTFLVGSIANALNHYFYRKPAYDITKDLVPVTQLVNVPNYLAVSTKTPFKSVAELLAYARENPGKLSCATTGIGTSTHLSFELFKRMAKVDITNVPYKGGAPALQDTVGGQTQMVFANEALPFIKDKRLTGLAVTTAQRSPLAPELPALSETLPGYDVTSWYCAFAPAGTPQDIVERMSAAMASIIKDEAVRPRLATLGATPVGSTPREFGNYLNTELKRWGETLKPMNIVLD